MKRLIHWLFGLPIALVVIAISVANRDAVKFSADPFSTAEPFFAIELPLFVLLLAAGFVGLVFGGVASWLSQGKWRRAARQARADTMRARQDHETLKRRLASQSEALPPPN